MIQEENINNINNSEDNIIININEINEDNTINDNDLIGLVQILINENIFNNKNTKILLKQNYDILINIINKLNINELFIFINYLNRINISVFKVIINGYLNFENINKEIIILEIITKIVNEYFNKNMFYFIYKKLSKIYRNPNTLNDINAIIKFKKLFNVWKILYDVKHSCIPNNEVPVITFGSYINNKNIFIIINKIIKLGKIKEFSLFIEFLPSFILDLNKYIDKFNFMEMHLKNCGRCKLKFDYDDIIGNNNNENINSFSKIGRLKFHFANSNLIIYINEIKLKNIKINFNISDISIISILNYFYGEALSITIDTIFSNNEKYKFEIMKNEYNQIDYNIFLNNKILDIQRKKDLLGENFFYHEIIILNDKNWKRCNLSLDDIRYFGGFESFIPLLKLIKNIISHLGSFMENDINNINNENIVNNYINESLIWVKDIMKIIIKMVCFSDINYKLFQKIIIPLISSLAEILHILNSLSSSYQKIKKNSYNYQSLLFNDEIFFIIYIIILNSNLSNNIKKIYKKLFGINDNYNYSMNSIIINVKEIKNIDWYFIVLFNIIEFMLLFYNSNEKIPKILIEQLNKIYLYVKENKEIGDNKNIEMAMEPFIFFVKHFYFNDEININKIFSSRCQLFYVNKYYTNYIINMIKTFLNLKMNIDNKIINSNSNIIFANIQQLIIVHILEGSKGFNQININHNIKDLIIDNFKYYIDNINLIQSLFQQLFPFLIQENFIKKDELLMNELIDYHGQYHHLMKEQFVFNKLWSNQKLFFNNTFDKIKNSKIKYKNINYYTRNFQRPIIYPVLDYINRYPEFLHFKIDKNFYTNGENKDVYNFDLECPELDLLIDEYDEEISKKINEFGLINKFENTCLVKQLYHIKGDLYIINGNNFTSYNNKIIIYFISYPFSLQNDIEKKPTCNKSIKDKKNLCYGSIFKCLKKEDKKKIKIYFDDIRLMMKRIYYYRSSAIEIFTQTKSYYFNFFNEEKMKNFFYSFIMPCQKSYFPININGNLNGFIKINNKISEKYEYINLIDKKINFIDFISNKISQKEICEMCIFDIIMLINIISNRSFIDLNQYPVFPLLYFCDKDYDSDNDNKIKNRDLKKHIGFQDLTNDGKKRAEMYNDIYDENNNKDNYDDNENCFFNTHYSNIIYTSNYLIRLLPFSFLAIELQGDGFDTPNRLFFSVENTYFSISKQKSDIRELIPEFYYFPEMFMNINCFNYGKVVNGAYSEVVNDVKINEQLLKYNILEVDKKKIKEKNNDNIIIENKVQKNIEKCFYYVENMKNNLELSKNTINNWINIIFGTKQRYNKKNKQYFRTESYINDENINKTYLNNDIIMKSLEFGIMPLQTIFDKNILSNIKKNNYDKDDKKEILNSIFPRRKSKVTKGKSNSIHIKNENNLKYEMNPNYFKNENKDYWDDILNIGFKISNDSNIGKLEIYNNNVLIDERIDHNDIIIDFFYNRRLNMFATTSIDGFICIYILPNKLICMIKHPNNSYYEQIFLSANPFPTLIAHDKKENTLTSYSINGILIKKIKLENSNNSESKIIPYFNIYGGTSKDRLIIISNGELCEYLIVPFFEYMKDE